MARLMQAGASPSAGRGQGGDFGRDQGDDIVHQLSLRIRAAVGCAGSDIGGEGEGTGKGDLQMPPGRQRLQLAELVHQA